MGHYILHSADLPERLHAYADSVGASEQELLAAYIALRETGIIAERTKPRTGSAKHVYISYIDLEHQIEDPVQRRLYHVLKSEIPARLPPRPGINLQTLTDRGRRAWEQIYNILISKIPSHWIRLTWLRAGGMKIGKGSSVWRNTEILGIENIVLGEDTCVGWHCLLDGRAGLIVGDHVTIASYVLIVAGVHELDAEDFGIVGDPIYIDDYAWLATRSMVVHGGRLGYGAVVGAGTIVNKEIAPYSVVGGFNAKPMGERTHHLDYRVNPRGLYNFLH
ncbi:acyltransferase [uncultured Thiohalocapsa sp.]|uniref:acyltransferase n=1 Tax=uncultured Thiohalocapsa sp. TaxID=768990 RepID=UPI0025FA0595|nr:acyltransferase [uncultured Thiohalocapsa sp.]